MKTRKHRILMKRKIKRTGIIPHSLHAIPLEVMEDVIKQEKLK